MSLAAAKIPDQTQTSIISPLELEATPLRCAYAYWRSIRGDHPYPARADIKPRDIAGILRHVSLVKYENGDFVYRIVGDIVVRAYDVTMQNRTFTELAAEEPQFNSIVRPVFQRCLDSGAPLAVRGQTGRDVVKVKFTDYEILLLPLGPQGGAVDHIMTVSTYRARSQY